MNVMPYFPREGARRVRFHAVMHHFRGDLAPLAALLPRHPVGVVEAEEPGPFLAVRSTQDAGVGPGAGKQRLITYVSCDC